MFFASAIGLVISLPTYLVVLVASAFRKLPSSLSGFFDPLLVVGPNRSMWRLLQRLQGLRYEQLVVRRLRDRMMAESTWRVVRTGIDLSPVLDIRGRYVFVEVRTRMNFDGPRMIDSAAYLARARDAIGLMVVFRERPTLPVVGYLRRFAPRVGVPFHVRHWHPDESPQQLYAAADNIARQALNGVYVDSTVSNSGDFA